MKKGIEISGSNPNEHVRGQQFVNKKHQLVRLVNGESNPVPVGEAYAFFYCSASEDEIRRELPETRRISETSSTLELDLTRLDSFASKDGNLMQESREALKQGNNYAIRAQHLRATNSQAADELADLLSHIHRNSSLYRTGEPFRGQVLYRENGEYISRE